MKRPDSTVILSFLLALGGLNDSRMIIHYIYNVKMNGESAAADRKAAEEVLEIVHKLIVEEITFQSKSGRANWSNLEEQIW
jgi:hypothetical protein